jgi:CheY-like chemotaxis protein/HPt (histidine-containing phosphotransfer) domain-containing protein
MYEELAVATLPDLAPFSAIESDVSAEVPSMVKGHPNRIRQILVACAQHALATRRAMNLKLTLSRTQESPTHVGLQFRVSNTAPSAAPASDEEIDKAIQDDFGMLVARRLARGLGGRLDVLEGGEALQMQITLAKIPEAIEVIEVVDAPQPEPMEPASAAAAVAPPETTVSAAIPSDQAPSVQSHPEQSPATPANATQTPAPQAPINVSELPEITLAGTRVLLAGSSGPSRVALHMAMRSLGCEGAHAETVEDACAQMIDSGRRMRPFHVCIADFSESGEEAEALALRVRESEELRHVQMLLLVELGSSGDADWAMQNGYSGYLTKPVDAEELGSVFKGMLQRSASAELVTRHSVRETQRRRLSCLVVDDDRVNLIALKTVLERLGHAVTTAQCGMDALEQAMWQRFDLILSDVRMPDIDGDEVAARLLAMQLSRGERATPIFAMSANSLAGDSQRCRAAGMRNYFIKPVTLPLLTQLVRYAMEEEAESGKPEPEEAETDGTESADSNDPPSAPAIARVVPEQEPEVERVPRFGEMTPIDLDHLEMASVGVPELRIKMLATFKAEMGAGMERLGTLLTEDNSGGVAITASALTSISASIGAMDCSRLLSEIERQATNGEMASIGPLYAQSLAEWDRVQQFIETLNAA